MPFGAWMNAAVQQAVGLKLAPGLTLQTLLRSSAPLIDAPVRVFDAVFATGLMSGAGDAVHQRLPPLSWVGLAVAIGAGAWRFGGLGAALWGLATYFYLRVFMLWPDSVETLAQMALAVPISVILGFVSGVFLHRHPSMRPLALTLLDQAQTVPLFAYLVPLVLFLGLGTAPAVCAVVIFAMPPMVRTTVLSLDESEARFGELASITGCTQGQRLWKVLVPTAAPLLRLGLNQVVLLSFSSAILASLVGASGLGNDVLVALQQLAIGRGLVAGLAITALAISLDKLLQGWTEGRGRLRAVPGWLFWPSIMVLPVLLTLLEPWYPALAHFPGMLTVQRTTPVDDVVDWLVTALYPPIAWLQWLLATSLLFPLRAAVVSLPWSVAVAAAAWGGWRLGGLRQAIFLGAPIVLMALAGIWPQAQQTIYLISAGSLLALFLGVPVGIVARAALWEGGPGHRRHTADFATLHLSDSRGHVAGVGRPPLDHRGGVVRRLSGGTLHGSRDQNGSNRAHGSGTTDGLYTVAVRPQDRPAGLAAPHRSRHQPDHPHGAVHGRDHRTHRHHRSRADDAHRRIAG